MKETTWVGPKGTTVVIRNGSNQPPLWALRLIDRVGARKRGARKGIYTKVGLRWTKGNGGGRYYNDRDWYPVVACRAMGLGVAIEKYILIHELAHWTGDRRAHGPRFYEALLTIARDEKAVGLFKNEAKTKMARARKALAMRVQDAA